MTTVTAEPGEPSEEFMTALKELKPMWNDNNTIPIELLQEKYNNLITLGKKEGLSLAFTNYKLNEITTNCNECNQQINIDRNRERLCPDCKDKKERQEYQEYQEETKREEDPIERYSNKILGIFPVYEISYEESKKIEEENSQYRNKIANEFLESEAELKTQNKPEGITKTQWAKEKRNKRRLLKAQAQEYRSDSKLRFEGSPSYLIGKRIDKIPCDCTAPNMRHGKFCKTCILLRKVNDYMLDLFKGISEGRSTVI